MATEAQINANRANAQRSTGPTTSEGKDRSRRNAVRHGILASVLADQTPGFDETLLGLYQGLRPMDESQRFLVDQIAISIVRLQRVLAAEQQYLDAASAKAADAGSPGPAISAYLLSESAALTLRYETALNRLIQRNLRLFREMKADSDWNLARNGRCPYVEGAQREERTGLTADEIAKAYYRRSDPTQVEPEP
jgi:hypothetical protein